MFHILGAWALKASLPNRVDCDSQQCLCIFKCSLMDGITEGNFVQESTYLYIIFCITWFFVLTNFSLKKYSFLPHPQSRSENVMGYLVGRTLLENPSVMELFL